MEMWCISLVSEVHMEVTHGRLPVPLQPRKSFEWQGTLQAPRYDLLCCIFLGKKMEHMGKKIALAD
jgi:hypothetical protein